MAIETIPSVFFGWLDSDLFPSTSHRIIIINIVITHSHVHSGSKYELGLGLHIYVHESIAGVSFSFKLVCYHVMRDITELPN